MTTNIVPVKLEMPSVSQIPSARTEWEMNVLMQRVRMAAWKRYEAIDLCKATHALPILHLSRISPEQFQKITLVPLYIERNRWSLLFVHHPVNQYELPTVTYIDPTGKEIPESIQKQLSSLPWNASRSLGGEIRATHLTACTYLVELVSRVTSATKALELSSMVTQLKTLNVSKAFDQQQRHISMVKGVKDDALSKAKKELSIQTDNIYNKLPHTCGKAWFIIVKHELQTAGVDTAWKLISEQLVGIAVLESCQMIITFLASTSLANAINFIDQKLKGKYPGLVKRAYTTLIKSFDKKKVSANELVTLKALANKCSDKDKAYKILVRLQAKLDCDQAFKLAQEYQVKDKEVYRAVLKEEAERNPVKALERVLQNSDALTRLGSLSREEQLHLVAEVQCKNDIQFAITTIIKIASGPLQRSGSPHHGSDYILDIFQKLLHRCYSRNQLSEAQKVLNTFRRIASRFGLSTNLLSQKHLAHLAMDEVKKRQGSPLMLLGIMNKDQKQKLISPPESVNSIQDQDALDFFHAEFSLYLARDRYFQEAWNHAISDIEDEGERDETIMQIARMIEKNGWLEIINFAIYQLKKLVEKSRSFLEMNDLIGGLERKKIIETLDKNNYSASIANAQGIQDNRSKYYALSKIAKEATLDLRGKGRMGVAKKALDLVEDSQIKERAYRSIARALIKRSKTPLFHLKNCVKKLQIKDAGTRALMYLELYNFFTSKD